VQDHNESIGENKEVRVYKDDDSTDKEEDFFF
jgi:hypothetical protein